MTLIDTHSHLYAEEFDGDRLEVLTRASAAGVGRMLLPAIDSESHAALFDLARRNPMICTPMMGLHPTSVNDNHRWREELALVESYLSSPPEGLRFCAVGEIGLDLYWSRDFIAEQTEAFRHQLKLAIVHDLPIVVHVRDAWEETLSVIRDFRGGGLRGVFHAFSGDEATYRELRDCGDFRFGIGGVVTFKKSPLVEVVRAMPLSDIVLETDCPYLTPAPHRGTRNEPVYVQYICNKIAEIKDLTPDEVASATTSNATVLFSL